MDPKDSDRNYFVCTLGEAAEENKKHPHDFKTINELLDVQAQFEHQFPVIGFPMLDKDGSLNAQLFTPLELRIGSLVAAKILSSAFKYPLNTRSSKCVALICASSVDFLFMWLGLLRLGRSVLLISPQLTAPAIAQLCKACNASTILSDRKYSELAELSTRQKSIGVQNELVICPWQISGHGIVTLLQNAFKDPALLDCLNCSSTSEASSTSETDIAYIFHTSGTSGGLPKPIPQSHYVAVGVPPCLGNQHSATFSTTPLYSGGIADCFRAWTSNAMIWVFPGAELPITSKNIIQCLLLAEKISGGARFAPSIKYFSSVPYVLNMLSEDSDGLAWLKKMEIVGVGGAALPPVVGDRLVSQGVNLASRFGSTECGFLLSSHRNYLTDQDWQYLRVPTGSRYLEFEVQEDQPNLFELVVLRGWPHMTQSNRVNGSFATSDLFEAHPSIPNAWKHHSRSDSQITLETGKKFDPAPIEDALASSSRFIREVLIVGTGRQFPGALIFLSDEASKMAEDELKDKVWMAVDEQNKKGQDHTRVTKTMMWLMPQGLCILNKSSKGTIRRLEEEERFEKFIEKLYKFERVSRHINVLPDSKVLPKVRKVVQQVVGVEKVMEDRDDFYNCGVDSAQASQIRSLLQREVAVPSTDLPWNIVYDAGNISQLAQLLIEIRSQKERSSKDDTPLMLDIVKRYRFKEPLNDSHERSSWLPCGASDNRSTVLLTGATGYLGTHILDLLRQETTVRRIICLVRASSSNEARNRISEGLVKRGKHQLNEEERDVECIPASLEKKNFGLEDELFKELSSETTIVIHAAWAVNFSLSLESFIQHNIEGLVNLLRFSHSCRNPVRFIFCSSTASVLNAGSLKMIPESISTTPGDSNNLGYSKSKWIAEAICNEYYGKDTKLSLAVVRIGQLTADTENGVWNITEAWPLMLSTVKMLGCLPALEENIDWLPVDIAAKAILQISMTYDEHQGSTCPVYHLVNNSAAPRWKDLLAWFKSMDGLEFRTVKPDIWLSKLEEVDSHPAKALLGFWRNAYGGDYKELREEESSIVHKKLYRKISFATEKTESVSSAIKYAKPIDEVLVKRIWAWLESEIQERKCEVP